MFKAEKFNLKNGLKTCVLTNKSVDSVTIHLKGLAGSNFEKSNQIGSAHLLQHLNLTQGNKNKLLSRGGKIIGVTSRDDVLYMVKVLKADVIDSLEFLSNIFNNPQFSKSEFEKQKEIAIQEITRMKNVPEKLIGRISHKLMFPKDRLAKFNTGDENDIRRLQTNNIADFRTEYYYPNNFVLVISGAVSTKNVLAYTQKYFGDFQKRKPTEYVAHKVYDGFSSQNYILQNSKQTHVKIDFNGYKTSEDKKYPALILSYLVDNYLRNLVKETIGLVYKINCASISTGSYGTFNIYFASDDKNVEKILSEIKRCFSNVESLTTVRNIEHIKTKILANLTYGFEKTSIRAEYYSDLLLHGRDEQDHVYEMKTIKLLTVPKVKALAKELLSQQPKITVISSGKNQIDVEKLWRVQEG